jgi:hypothetical protein
MKKMFGGCDASVNPALRKPASTIQIPRLRRMQSEIMGVPYVIRFFWSVDIRAQARPVAAWLSNLNGMDERMATHRSLPELPVP